MKGQIKNYIKFIAVFVLTVFVCIGQYQALAKDLVGTNFIVRDPIIGTGGEYGTSTNFKLFSSGDTLLTGIGTGSTFIGRYGFLYYPFVNSGVLSAVQNSVDVDLSWSSSVAGGGWTVGGYKTGVAGVSGGPYTYTNVGLVTSYTYNLVDPGYYCYVLQTLDNLGYVITISNEDCITVVPVISFSISDNNINFGTLSSSGPRYADTTTGSATDVVAHTMSASSNASSGYAISYSGATLTSGGDTIDVASSVSGDGSAGVEQFGMSVSTNGSATIPSGYLQSGPTRTFVAGATTNIASTSGVSTTETFSNHYLANISNITDAGTYSSTVTFIATGTF